MGVGALIGAAAGMAAGAAGWVLAGFTAGTMWIAGAAIGSLFDSPDVGFDLQSPTYSFGPVQNTKTQILPIPIVYGRNRVAGNIFYENFLDDQKTEVVRMIGISEGPVHSITSVKAGDVNPATLDGCAVYTYTNTTASTTTPLDPAGTRPYPNDLAMVAVKLKAQEKLRGAGVITSIVEGRTVWTPDGVKFSRNPAWIIRDLLTNTRYGLGIPEDRLDDTSFEEVAAYCDELVDGEPRFTLDYVIDNDRPAHDVLKDMLACFRGFIKRRNKISLCVDAPVPTYYKAIGPDNIVKGSFSWWQKPQSEMYNQVTIEWIDPDNHWERSTAFFEDTEDVAIRGAVSRSFSLLGITSKKQVERMGAFLLDSSRLVRNFCSFSLGIQDADIDVGDVIAVTHDLPGWENKWFRVVRVIDNKPDEPGQITVVCSEYRAEVYNDRAEPFVPHIDTSTPDPLTCPDVENVTAQEFIQVNKDGTITSNIDVAWTDPEVPLLHVEVAILEEGASNWRVAGLVSPKVGNFVIRNVKASQSVSIRVRAINEKGIKATGVIVGLTLYGKALPPGPVTNLAVESGPGMIKLSWTNPSDPDFSHVDIVEYKGAAQPSDPSEGTLVASINSTSLTRAGLEEVMTYWYWIRSVDTSGNVSAWLGPVSGVTQMTVIDTINIADLAITETKIANDSISAPKLKANSVDANKITAGAVTTEKIATNAITTDRIAANAVTADKINVDILSAIAADLGTVTAGVAKSADGKFEIDLVNRTLKVFDDQGRLRVQLGKLR